MVKALTRAERRQAILSHIARYTFSLRVVIEHLFFKGKSCDSVLRAMIGEGLVAAWPEEPENGYPLTAPIADSLLSAESGESGSLKESKATVIPGGYKYYQLTRQAAKLFGLPPSRTNPPGPGAFDRHLALLWFCCMRERRLNLLDSRNIAKLFSETEDDSSTVPGGPYCVELVDRDPRVFRVLMPGAMAKDLYHTDQFQNHLDEALSHPVLSRWIETRRLAYVFLVANEDRRKKLFEQIKGTGVHDTVRVEVATVPTHQTFEMWLKTKPQPEPKTKPKAKKQCSIKPKFSNKSKGSR